MIFWIAAAILTLIVVMLIIRPFFQTTAEHEAASSADFDVEVYKRQLRELEDEAATGLIGAQEAAAARAEVGRRLLRADETASSVQGGGVAAASRLGRALAILLVVAVPVAAIALYLPLGAPGLSDAPFAARTDEIQQARAARNQNTGNLTQMAERLTARLQEEPDDGDGWLLLARTQMTLDRYADAIIAYDRAAQLDPGNPVILSGLGEAIVFRSEGAVTPEAVAAFRRAAEAAGGALQEPRAAYYLAEALYQTGNRADALEAWIALGQAGDPAAPWYPAVFRKVAEVGDELGRDTAGLLPEPAAVAAAPSRSGQGPTAEQVDEMRNLSPEERQARVNAMVDALADRLAEDPSDFEGWMRLVRARAVLGQIDQANTDLAAALTQFERAPVPRRMLLQLADELNLAPPESVAAESDGGSQPNAAPGPRADDIAAAQTMSEEDRQAMVDSMVAGLAERLQENPDDREGWIRLARSYDVLGRPEDALQALVSAEIAFPDDVEFKLLRGRLLRAEAGTRTTEEGQALMRAVVELDSTNTEAHWFLGLAAIDRGDAAAAAGHFDQAVAGLPEGSPERAALIEQRAVLMGR
ncbi:MAG: c-type cytochrome biogenesis protein CcmI [Alphaproteobacteria bacterium]|nr:c-type cytochrome biogenesis protein CcmI [Alphaproteobacteria bacterium]